ncbi:MAG: 1-deoxy-D-xylulose-5-phosphate synthase [Alphaproteobacteria bacterium]
MDSVNVPSESKESFLDNINTPVDLRKLKVEDLPILAQEIRNEIINSVANTGGHLGASLGVVELTLALHYVFNTPKDKLIWDVGHQCYPHKIITGRRDAMPSLRQKNGISGFTCRSESEFDPFGAGHSSTSISAGLGMAIARDLKGDDNNVICVIGDGSMSGGMSFEALNNAGSMNTKLIVILNDNDMSIAPPVGALSAYLSELISSKPYLSFRQFAMDIASKFPKYLEKTAKKAEEYARGLVTGGTLFEELGFYYVGPIDGHNFDHLVPILKNVKEAKGPEAILIHVVTQKGKGYTPAEEAPTKYHGVAGFNVETGNIISSNNSNNPDFTSIFSQSLIKEGERDSKIVAICAAMPEGTGLDKFAKRFPERFFDVGIAEQHAVTYAAGLACEGYKPFIAIYSSFLQRAYDQIVHDVALQHLPVKFAIDRAGFVGGDGATHHGMYDTCFLSNLPDMVVMAPSNQQELIDMVATAAAYNDGAISFRYPRGFIEYSTPLREGRILDIGKGVILKEGSKTAIIGIGTIVAECLKAVKILKEENITPTVVDARFAKPIDTQLILDIAKEHQNILLVEEAAIGGFASQVCQFLIKNKLFEKNLKIDILTAPDAFIKHDTRENQIIEAGLDAQNIALAVKNLMS